LKADFMAAVNLRELLAGPLPEIMNAALAAKLRHRGDSFSLCTIMNARSGKCSEDCSFCAQSSRYSTSAPVYGLVSADEAVRQAERARDAGATRFSIVTSGKGPADHEIDAICGIVSAVRRETGLDVCCSLGIAGRETMLRLRDAGVKRYHHNLESSREFFPGICSTHKFDERIATIKAAASAGLEVCSGGIIGLGETEEDRISMASLLADLDVDSVPLNILVPIRGTPLEGCRPLAMDAIIRAVAIFRLLLPNAAIRLAGGRESALTDFLALACMAGADGMLTGGYLTVRGRDSAEDRAFVRRIRAIWRGCV
jgi:biotin synthase